MCIFNPPLRFEIVSFRFNYLISGQQQLYCSELFMALTFHQWIVVFGMLFLPPLKGGVASQARVNRVTLSMKYLSFAFLTFALVVFHVTVIFDSGYVLESQEIHLDKMLVDC